MRALVQEYVRRRSWRSLILDWAGKAFLFSFVIVAIGMLARPSLGRSLLEVGQGHAFDLALGVLGLVLASMAIITSFGDDKYLKFLDEHRIYPTLMLQFFWTASGSCLGMLLFALAELLLTVPGDGAILPWLAPVYVGAFVWIGVSALACVHLLVRISLLRMKYVRGNEPGA